jgi:hypothetical protein
MDEAKTEAALAFFKQHWEHARHAETQRLTVMQTFSAFVVGTAAFARDQLFSRQWWPLLLLLGALAIFGACLSLKVAAIFRAHVDGADNDLQRARLGSFEEQVPYDETNWVVQHLSVSRLFTMYFLAVFCATVGGLLHALGCGTPLSVLVATALLLPSFILSGSGPKRQINGRSSVIIISEL